MTRTGAGPNPTGPAPPVASVVCRLPVIAIEVPLACDLPAARRIFEAPGELLRLWPGVEWVRLAGTAFHVRQRLELPFWDARTLEFAVRIEAAPRDRRQRYALWKTDGWFFNRAVLWKLRAGRHGVTLDFASQHSLSAERLEEAVNAYRSRAIWPMRHDSDAILERLATSFIHDRLVALDRAYVGQVQAWIGAQTSPPRPRRNPPAAAPFRRRGPGGG